MKISVIIPLYNEESTIIRLLNKVNAQKKSKVELEIIVIDDCSTDNTNKLLKENGELFDIIIELKKNLGKGGAVRKGLEIATGDYILFQDGDLEYNPDDYKKIFKMLENHKAEIVIGSRFLAPEFTRVHYFFHKVGNRLITLLFNILYNTTFTDIYSCYVCFKAELIDPKKLKTNGWQQHAEILATAVKKSQVHYEVPISYAGRTFDEGKKIKARHTISVVYTIIKKRFF
jgi:glycosyltransferase involved in cell wall biosynthesis